MTGGDSIKELKRQAGIAPYPINNIKDKIRCFNAQKHTNGDKEPSLSFYEKDGEIRWHCHPCNIDGDIPDYLQKTEGLTQAEAIEKLKAITGNGSKPKQSKTYSNQSNTLTLEQIKALEPEPGYKFSRHHVYTAGEPQYIKALYRNEAGDKTGRFFTITGENCYQWNRQSKAVLYNQATLQERPSDTVFDTEGEKDTNTLAALG